eukprot:1435262-Prorocentrum_lima.AAC.1
MTSSLVGSEMCIRDRPKDKKAEEEVGLQRLRSFWFQPQAWQVVEVKHKFCLLYTSDAADDM